MRSTCALLAIFVSAVAPAASAAEPFILPSDSTPLDIGEGQVRILADKAATGGAWATLERTEPPGTRTALHRHNGMDEAFYVVSGTFSVYLNGQVHTLTPGAFVFIPRGTPHAQGNSSSGLVKLVSFFSPAGWEQSARDRAALQSHHPSGSKAFADQIGDVFKKHEIEVLGPSPIPKR